MALYGLNIEQGDGRVKGLSKHTEEYGQRHCGSIRTLFDQ